MTCQLPQSLNSVRRVTYRMSNGKHMEKICIASSILTLRLTADEMFGSSLKTYSVELAAKAFYISNADALYQLA